MVALSRVVVGGTLALSLVAGGCTQGGSGSTSSSGGAARVPVYQESQGLKACVGATLEDGVALGEGQRCFTYRALGGVSMGGGSAARIGFHYPELFDAIGVMGTPFSDFDYFYNMLATNHMAGFCSREQLLALLAANPNNPGILDDPTVMDAYCGQHGQDIPGDLAVPDSQCWAFRSDFNHWYRGPDEGRGGSFNRPSLLEIIQDITATYGNVAYYNPDNTYTPPGVPVTARIPPNVRGAEEAAMRQDLCANPTVLTNFRHAQWNPDGSFPVITFCDCANCDGDYVPGRIPLPTEVLLAVDYNRNNKRDYAEPVVWMGHEPFRDVGPDGKEAGEAGDDPSDEYVALTNPGGRANNFRFDLGEPYEDVGLDGIPGTGDFGEGDGKLTLTPALERALNDSPTRWYNRMSDSMVNRIDVWMDAGIRDFINSAQITNNLFGAIKARVPDSRLYRDFSDLADLPPGWQYLFTGVDFSTANLGRNAYLLYGNPDICPGSDADGNGNHVGPPNVVINRLLTLFAFVDARMPGGDRSYINAPSAADDVGGDFGQHLKMETYPSTALGRAQEYGIVLPPGYFYEENAGRGYPVIYFLHGQGQSARDMVASGAIFMGYMFQSANSYEKSDLQKFILVFADGECREELGECHTGNFYSDFQGTNGNGPKFEQAFLELMRHVDTNYRTRKPEVH